MSWSRPLEDPIILPDGRRIVTLRDAGDYMMELTETEQALPQWQAAVEAVIMAAEGEGPLLHARTGMLQAINQGKPAPVIRARKPAKTYRILR